MITVSTTLMMQLLMLLTLVRVKSSPVKFVFDVVQEDAENDDEERNDKALFDFPYPNKPETSSTTSRSRAFMPMFSMDDINNDTATDDGCINKLVMVEETEYDDVVQCNHSYDRRCHTTYVTQYQG